MQSTTNDHPTGMQSFYKYTGQKAWIHCTFPHMMAILKTTCCRTGTRWRLYRTDWNADGKCAAIRRSVDDMQIMQDEICRR